MARVGARDTLPLAGQRVVLHEVGRAGGAPVDSARTDGRGGYRLTSPRGDTTAVYFVSVLYGGVNYVSVPLREMRRREIPIDPLLVYDTSSTSPRIGIDQRHLIVRAPEADGSRHVLELIVLHNAGSSTRISNDTLHPVWAAALPKRVIQFQVGESDVSDQAIVRRGDSLLVFAPVPPGDKQVMVQYVLPGSESGLTLPIDQGVDRLNVLVDDTLASLVSGPLVPVGVESMDDTRYERFAGEHAAPGETVVVKFGASPRSLSQYWWVIVVLAGTGLVVGLRLAMRGRVVVTVSAEGLAAQIAALDAQLEEAGVAMPAAAAAANRQRRAELKARLNAALASAPPKP
ncbi:MAG TPA: hypothetical protein VGI83_07320 [Gemmatimonadales bacterium]